jgi:hypothetical protein
VEKRKLIMSKITQLESDISHMLQEEERQSYGLG